MTRTARHSFLAPALLAALVAALLAGPAATASPAGTGAETPELVVVLDSSGSMAEADGGGGQTRMAAAQQAVVTMAEQAPASARIGLRTYGDGVDSEAPGSCEDTTLQVPVGPVDRAAITSAVRALAPRGDTPIGVSLRAAAGDLTTTGPRSIVLVSDGEPTCDPDPCVVAGELKAQGVDLRIDVVGFRVGAQARQVLECVAAAGGGTYVDAADAGDVTDALDTSLDRGFRVYQPEGTPVVGTPTPAGAPRVEEGQYLDAITGPSTRHYLLDVPDGWTVRAGVTITRGDDPQRRGVGGTIITSLHSTGSVTGAAPVQCVSSIDGSDNQRGSAPLSGAVLAGPGALDGYSWVQEACGKDGEYLLEVEWTGSDSPEPAAMELLVDLEPPVAGTGGTGTRSDETTVFPELQPLPGPVAVTGGTSFNDATLLGPGAWSDSMRTGETVFYRVPVDWGQQLAVRVDFLPRAAGSAVDDVLGSSDYANILLFDETRGQAFPIGSKSKRYTVLGDEAGGYMAITTHPVVWANRAETVYNEVRRLSAPQDLFLMLSMDGDDTSADALGLAVPYTVSVGVIGEPQEGPTYVETAVAGASAEASAPASSPAPDPSTPVSTDASPPATDTVATGAGDGGGGGVLLPALLTTAAVLVATLVALVAWGLRRSRARTPGPLG